MLGLVISIVASATPLVVSAAPAAPAAPPPSASVTCPDGPASCDAAQIDEADDADGDLPPTYATPAVIVCNVPAALQPLVIGECDGTPRDLWYRASRYPESEDSGGAVTPAGPAPRHNQAACTSVPPDGGDLTVSSPQPLAVYGLPDEMAPIAARAAPPGSAFTLPSRIIEPPERPPRASV
jgi:hypothetical protein